MKSGTSLGPYRIDRELGSGGMGKVYAAVVEGRCPGLAEGTRVALKIVHPHLLETPGFFKRFLREGEIGKTVRHENVVQTFDCDSLVSGGTRADFLAMEYVEGQTLRELMVELDRVPEELCRHIAREVCKGLSAIHAAGVIHRDMKPDNVLITEDHVVKVMDLGVARLTDEVLRLSQTGAFVGSIHYAAPECFSRTGAVVDGRADLHALGLVLYELSCGTNPYLADRVPQILQKVLNDEPRRLGDVNPQLSPFFEEVVHNLLAKSPDDRIASARDLLGVLEKGEDSDWWRARARSIQAATKRPIRRIRIPRETSVYGRDKEIATLCALYERAKSGDGQVVLLEGEAGIGKSRLVDEFISRLHRDGEDFNFLFGSYPPGGAATASGAFSAAFHEHFGEEGVGPYLKPTPLLVPAFDALLSGDAPPREAQPLTSDSVATCFVHATRGLAAERTTVVLIDDLHFAPDEARALFTSLAMGAPGRRLVLIGSTRPGISEDWRAGLTRLSQTTSMAVGRLGPKDLIELLQDSFKSEALASSLAAQIALKSDGNPFFAFEIIRGLREDQFIERQDDGSWVSTQVIEDIQIPSSVLDLVNARVADLTEDERDLLDVASCWGYEFDPALVGEVVGLARIPALKRFGQIERQHRLARSVGRNYVFDHHQVQEALYGGLNEQLSEEYHAALADVLATRTKAADTDPETLDGSLAVDLCEHYLRGARGAEALRYLPAARTHLTKGYLHAEVAALSERALAVPGLLTATPRVHALIELCQALDPMGRRERQEEAALEAERLAEDAGDLELRRRAAMMLGMVLRRTARHEQAGVVYTRARELACELGDRRSEAAAIGNLGLGAKSMGHTDEALELFAQHIAISREIGDRHSEALGLGNTGSSYWSLGRLADAREYIQQHLDICRSVGDGRGELIATGNLGNVLADEGRIAEARALYERQLTLSREIGYREGETAPLGNLGSILHYEGRLAEARERFDQQLVLCREIGYRDGECIALHNLGEVLKEQGDVAGAEAMLEECLSLCLEIGHQYVGAATQRVLGSLRASRGELDRARELLVPARDTAAAVGEAGIETLARCDLACLPGGDPRDAIAAFDEHRARLDVEELLEARFVLWRASGDRAQLEEAKRLLDASVANVDDEIRESMLTNLHLHREIMAAWEQHGGTDAAD